MSIYYNLIYRTFKYIIFNFKDTIKWKDLSSRRTFRNNITKSIESFLYLIILTKYQKMISFSWDIRKILVNSYFNKVSYLVQRYFIKFVIHGDKTLFLCDGF